jgi:hypothetical protein
VRFEFGFVHIHGAAGNFVVVWASNEESGDIHGIFGQLYTSNGQLQGSRISVSTTATYDDLVPAVAMTADGRFLVTWQANGPGGWSILARVFQASGSAVSGEMAVNLPAAGARHWPPQPLIKK